VKTTFFALLMIGVTMFGFSPRVFAQTAVIKELTGTVELKPSGAVDFVPASVGAEVAQNTIISTGFKSTALVQAGSAVIAVRPLTRLTLTEIQASQGTETLNMNLQSGRVRVDLNPPAGSKASLGISSPTATASVRGTSFDFDTRNLRVHSGTVAFTGKWGYQVSVQEGHTSVVGASGTAGASQSFGNRGFMSQQGAGYDNTTTTTGDLGFVNGDGKEERPLPLPPSPPSPPPATPPSTPGGNPGSGSGGGSGGSPPPPTTGGVDITVTFD